MIIQWNDIILCLVHNSIKPSNDNDNDHDAYHCAI